MGVLNITPDSFSDGGRFADPSDAVAAALAMVADGADLIDIGGESTRPGSSPIDAEEQIRRVATVITAIRRQSTVTLSIDTTRGAVALAALDAGANVVNDISAGRDDPAMLPLIAQRRAPVILMHMQGTPATMQVNPSYSDVVGEVSAFLRERIEAAASCGIDPADVLVDPGIGFGKTLEHNLALLRHVDKLAQIGQPLVIGTSRKAFIAKITGEGPTGDRLLGTAATVAWSIANGAAVVRVHDVGPIVRVVRMIQAIRATDPKGS
jgi:dihydropteroate synthase